MSKKISKKLIVSALSTGMGVSLVGAITGTVAWYQYSTRSTVSFVGTSVGTSENLLVSLDNSHFYNDLSHTEVATAVGDTQLAPITTGNIVANGALQGFKAQPIYQHFAYNQWVDAGADAYVQFDLYLKLNMLNEQGQEVPVNEQRNVYLSDLLIRQHRGDTQKDISDAVRVHISDGEDVNRLLSKKGETIDVHGELDLNDDGRADTLEPIYSFYTQEDLDLLHTGTYGNGTQEALDIEDVKPITDAQGQLSGGQVLGTLFSKAVVPADGTDVSGGTYFTDPELEHQAIGTADGSTPYYVSQDVLTLSVTIWLEGWQQLLVDGQSKSVTPAADTNLAEGDFWTDQNLTEHATGTANGSTPYYTHVYDSIWDANDYIGSQFDVGLLFEVDA